MERVLESIYVVVLAIPSGEQVYEAFQNNDEDD